MKRVLTLFLFCLPLVIYSQDYYWYKGKQIPLKRGTQRYILYEKGLKNLDIIEGGEVSFSKDEKLQFFLF